MRSSAAWSSSETTVSSGQISSRTKALIQSSCSWNSGSVEKSHAMCRRPLTSRSVRSLWCPAAGPGARCAAVRLPARGDLVRRDERRPHAPALRARPALERPAHLPERELVAATGEEGARHAHAALLAGRAAEAVDKAAAPRGQLLELRRG